MHQQFLQLDRELKQYQQYAEVRQRVKDRYAGYMLATLVSKLEMRDRCNPLGKYGWSDE